MIPRRLGLSILAALLSFSGGAIIPATAADAVLPRPDCQDISDPANDSKFEVVTAAAPVEVFHADPKIDISDVMIGTKGRTLLVYLKVPGLDGTSTDGAGPRFEAQFDVKGATNKRVLMIHAKHNTNNLGQAYAAASARTFPVLYVGGTSETESSFTATLDTTNKFVMFTISLDYLATKSAVSTANGVELINFSASSKVLTTSAPSEKSGSPAFSSADTPMDRAPNANAMPSVHTYVVGANKCFAPPASKLAGLTGTSAQFSDAANLTAKLTNEAGDTPVAGKKVTFAIAGKSVTATTGADGVAKAALAHGKTAGSYPLTVTFAGDDSYSESQATGTLVVKQETARISSKVTGKSGKNRTVTVNVADDDRAAIAGQNVNFYVNGKRTTKKSDAKGNAVFTAAAGQTVYAELPAVAGRYLAAKTAPGKLA